MEASNGRARVRTWFATEVLLYSERRCEMQCSHASIVSPVVSQPLGAQRPDGVLSAVFRQHEPTKSNNMRTKRNVRTSVNGKEVN